MKHLLFCAIHSIDLRLKQSIHFLLAKQVLDGVAHQVSYPAVDHRLQGFQKLTRIRRRAVRCRRASSAVMGTYRMAVKTLQFRINCVDYEIFVLFFVAVSIVSLFYLEELCSGGLNVSFLCSTFQALI